MQSQISNSIPQQQKKQTNKTEQLPLQKPVFIKPYRNNKNKQIRCKIVLLGAPGSGKGTYGQYLKEYFDATVIATGDLVREQVKKKTSIGKLCEDIINKGQLLSDDIVNKIVTEKISYINNDDNYILDGYPRKFSQLIHLYNTTDIISPNVAIYIHVPDEVVITKALGRRICKDCGAGYNINSIYYNNGEYNMPALLPRVSGICDKVCYTYTYIYEYIYIYIYVLKIYSVKAH